MIFDYRRNNEHKLIVSTLFFCTISVTGLIGIELKKPEKYEAPKDEQEAKKAWDDAEAERNKAEKERETRKEDLKKTIDDLNKENKLPKPDAKKMEELRIKQEFEMREIAQAEVVKKDWEVRQKELSQNDLVKQYTASLGKLLEPVEELPSGLQRFLNQVRIWIKTNIQIPFNTWTGDVNKVIEIRQQLAKLYTEFGKQGLLERARNNKELAKVLDNLNDKISAHFAALQDYKDALTKGTVSEAVRSTLRQEMEQLVVDLIGLDKELSDRKVDQKIRDAINKVIDATLEALGISLLGRRALEERAGIAQKTPTNIEDIQQLAGDVGTGFNDVSDMVKKDPLNFIATDEYKTFMRDLASLERVDVAKITDPTNQALVANVILNSYKTLNDGIRSAVNNFEIPPADRLVLVARWMELVPKNQEVEDTYQRYFNNFVAREGRAPTAQEIGVQPPLAKGIADNIKTNLATSIKNIEVGKNIFNPVLLKEYQKLIEGVSNWNDIIDAAAVSEESLDARQAIYDAYNQLLKNVNDAADAALRVNPNEEVPFETAAVILSIMDRINESAYLLELDRSMLVIIKEGMHPKVELVQAAERPENVASYVDSLLPGLPLEEIEKRLKSPETSKKDKDMLYKAQQFRLALEKEEHAFQLGALQQELLAKVKSGPQLRPVSERGERVPIVRPPKVKSDWQKRLVMW